VSNSCRLVCILIVALAGVAQAQDYPSKPIRLITPAAQGGTTDLLARLFGAKLSEVFKQQVIVDNRASASGVIAGDMTAKAAPDGYTLLLAYHQHTINAALNPNLPYHPVNDFTPITQLTRAGLLLLVHPSAPPRTLQEFIEWTKSRSGELNYGSAGLGSGGHLAGELYNHMTGVRAQHIPYKGSGPAMVDLMGGRYDYNFAGLQGAQVQVRSGKLRALAVTTPQRIAALPDIPAVAEAVPGYEVVGWYGVIGPPGMPLPLVARLHEELLRVLAQPDVRERIVNDGSEPVGTAPREFRDFMAADLAKWAKLVKESGAKLD
jgi:tripartite-type tricarboxylate transporter receptor subunit TctC